MREREMVKSIISILKKMIAFKSSLVLVIDDLDLLISTYLIILLSYWNIQTFIFTIDI